MGQYDQVHEEIVKHLVKETNFGKDVDKVVADLKASYGGGMTSWTKWEMSPTTRSKWFTKEVESLHMEFCIIGSPTCRAWAWLSRPRC